MAAAAAGPIQPLKRLQRLRPGLGADACAAIPHLNPKSVVAFAAQHQPQGRPAMAEGVVDQVADGPAQSSGLNTGLQRFEIELQLIGLDRRAELRQPLIQWQRHSRLRITTAGEEQKLGCDPLQRIEIGLGPLLLSHGRPVADAGG